MSLRKDREDAINIKIIHLNYPAVMCEDRFDLNVRMASHGNIPTANRYVGLEPSESYVIPLVTCMEADACQGPKTLTLLTVGIR